MILRVAVEGGWFHALDAEGSPKTAADLAQRTGAEELLIGNSYLTDVVTCSTLKLTNSVVRFMRALTAAGIVEEKGPQTYASTPITKALTIPKIYDGIKHL